MTVSAEEQAPELTTRLFRMGSELLLSRMSDILSDRGKLMARAQDSSEATLARKVLGEEYEVLAVLPQTCFLKCASFFPLLLNTGVQRGVAVGSNQGDCLGAA